MEIIGYNPTLIDLNVLEQSSTLRNCLLEGKLFWKMEFLILLELLK
jgi:hypothetical protein